MLARVERKIAGEPVVFIGVHSPKFVNERDERMVHEAVKRYGVTDPVVVDVEGKLWDQYAVKGWPTLTVIDPQGYVLGQVAGEPDAAQLESVLRRILGEYRAHDAPFNEEPLPLAPPEAHAGRLAYPGKVLVDGERLFVADTGHHQIVELALAPDGSAVEKRRFGSGEADLRDGFGASVAFQHPNGLALDGQNLFVADTGNHAVRVVSLESGSVRTVAGNGEQGRGAIEYDTRYPCDLRLRSPWDLAFDADRGRLYVAMAGSHQLFVYTPRSESFTLLAGTGREARVDGPAQDAAFAQPSGLALLGDRLYVVDSEISCVRALDLASNQVRTLAGGDLFDFGDDDGPGERARFQHPMGICAADGALLVADSFNHKLKRVDPETGRVTTLFGNGEPSMALLLPDTGLPKLAPVLDSTVAAFFEPEGVSAAGGVAYVADTNNHRVVRVALATGEARVVFGEGS